MTVPQASFKGAGDPSEVYADLLRLYILRINVMLGVVTWTESNMGSIVFQTEGRGRGCVSRIPGKSLGVICSYSKAECFLFCDWPRKGWASLQHLCSCSNSRTLDKLCSPQAWPLFPLLREGHVAPSTGNLPGCSLGLC